MTGRRRTLWHVIADYEARRRDTLDPPRLRAYRLDRYRAGYTAGLITGLLVAVLVEVLTR